jgi:hypothetical protein
MMNRFVNCFNPYLSYSRKKLSHFQNLDLSISWTQGPLLKILNFDNLDNELLNKHKKLKIKKVCGYIILLVD